MRITQASARSHQFRPRNTPLEPDWKTEMTTHTATRNFFFPTSALTTLVLATTHYIRENREARRERRRQRMAIRQLRGIHNHTLRDIGIDRSEIASTVMHGRMGR